MLVCYKSESYVQEDWYEAFNYFLLHYAILLFHKITSDVISNNKFRKENSVQVFLLY